MRTTTVMQLNNAIKNYQLESPTKKEKKEQITIRVEPDVNTFLKFTAENTGLTVQSLVHILLRSKMQEGKPTKEELQTQQKLAIVERFFRLFEAHNIDIGNIHEFFRAEKLKTSELMDSSNILALLSDNKVLQKIENIFNVSWQWLKTGEFKFPDYKQAHTKLQQKDAKLILLCSDKLDISKLLEAQNMEGIGCN